MLIGRERESKILMDVSQKEDPQLIAVYGRRRVGKTYLIRQTFQNSFVFQHAGIYKGSRSRQLRAFWEALVRAGLPESSAVPRDWQEAFFQVEKVIRQSIQSPKVIFIDELSWMDTPKSDLIMALEHFWNAWASTQKNLVLILCSSATSWILNKVIQNKGGLYNRLTLRIHLQPFSLAQCKTYTDIRHLALSNTQIMELFMAIGGVPYYWEQLVQGYSVSQNIDHLFFSPDAPLKNEYEYLFAAIFRNPDHYLSIVSALAGKKQGLTRGEILQHTGLTGSGTISRQLEELESCGFIRAYTGFGKKSKDAIYQLIDPFVLFYHHFLSKKQTDPYFWSHQINTPGINTWCGLAFEQICLLHESQIKKALGISGILTDVFSFVCKADQEAGIEGSQIDLVIWRADRIINLLEMKYTQGPYAISRAVSQELRRKANDFALSTKTKCGIHTTLVTPYGLKWNEYAGEIQSQVTAEDLFQP